MLEKYEEYLKYIDAYIKKCFDDQKPYIYCKEGCSFCCETGEYPFSQLEFEYLKSGMVLLSDDLRNKIFKNIDMIKFKDGYRPAKKYYQCPFLIEKKCSVYKYRGIICRTFGLMHFLTNDKDEMKYNIPACVSEGLNYHTVYDEKREMISTELYNKLEHKVEPLSYNLSLKFLIDNDRTANLEFGEVKALIDWF